MSHENMSEIRYTEGVKQVEEALELHEIYGIALADAHAEHMSDDELWTLQSACENLATACALELEERNITL